MDGLRRQQLQQKFTPLLGMGTSSSEDALSAVQDNSDDYGGPLSLSVCIPDPGHEILRPKPRRPSRGWESQMVAEREADGREPAQPQPQPQGQGHSHRHPSLQELRRLQRCQQRQTSWSAATSSSGHESMSDAGSCSARPLRSVPEEQLASSGSGLEDIKLAIQQLTLRSHTSSSSYSSLETGRQQRQRRLVRHSSVESLNCGTSAADEFLWLDSHSRLVELGQLPWTQQEALRALQQGRAAEQLSRLGPETLPRLSYLLQRPLVRLAREAQRLARPLGLCGRRELLSALRLVLSPALAEGCAKACLRAAAVYALPAQEQLLRRQSKAQRAGLHLPVGRLLGWMREVRLARMVHEYGAVYLAAALENLLEELVLCGLAALEPGCSLSASRLEQAIAASGDLWGLLQPFAHLNAGRLGSGALAAEPDPEPGLLATCVGSPRELEDLLARLARRRRALPLAPGALNSLFYYMRCSQLEHGEHGERGALVQELAYERPYVVLPPLIEWLRVAGAHAEHRYARCIDHDDIGQAARLLLPGVDCPVRPIASEQVGLGPNRALDDLEYVRRFSLEMGFKLLLSGRPELIAQALGLLPAPTKINTLNEAGLSALMLACVNGDEAAVLALLEAGADLNVETPSPQALQASPSPASTREKSASLGASSSSLSQSPNQNNHFQALSLYAETQHWTALTYTALLGHCNIARILLERGAAVEGGARPSEDKPTITPLQAASASGNNEMVALLLAHGAQPFLSTLIKDPFCYSGSAQRGCYSAISVAAAHGQRSCLHQLLSHPLNFSPRRGEKEVLSLQEILAEENPSTVQQHAVDNRGNQRDGNEAVFSKAQNKALQESMYHSAESNHLDITMELRRLKVPWTLHCWMHSLSTAHEMRIDSVVDQLLQDFLQVCPDDYSTQFVQECLPLLFNIFRHSKKEGTTLLLADIFCTCFGWEPIKPIRDTTLSSGSRIDPKFVNNPELSDVQFRVEGRVFYGHKIVLVTSSPRFRNMLSSKLCEGNPPIVQINDIRYHIFQLVMEFLYYGGCANLQVNQSDVLELMAAANFFQLDGLLRFCETQCSTVVDVDNIVSMYIHAKVYNAVQLLEYCQGFLLQNMVALLTYDDSVKRLLFAKKLPNHDVLAGLLLTLQARLKARRSQYTK